MQKNRIENFLKEQLDQVQNDLRQLKCYHEIQLVEENRLSNCRKDEIQELLEKEQRIIYALMDLREKE